MKAGWTEAPLGEMCAVVRSVVDASEIETGTPYIGLEHIAPGGELLDLPSVTAGELGSTKFRFDPSHVLFGKLRPNLAKVTRAPVAGVCSTDILPLAAGSGLEPDYLMRFLRHPETVALAAGRTTGVSLPRLSARELGTFRIPLPPLAYQRRIARALDLAEKLQRRRRVAIERLDELVDAAFHKRFSVGVQRSEVLGVGDLIDRGNGGIRTGPFGSQLLHSEFVESGVAVLGIDNAVHNEFRWGAPRHITEEKYKLLQRYTVNPGDVLITIMGTCGRAAIVPDEIPAAINTKHLCCITLDRERCEPEFLHSYFLRHRVARAYLGARANGAIMSGLNMGIIKELPVELPPIRKQREFVNELQKIRSAKASARQHATELDALFGSIQDRAFTGEL